jgi:hypothetical protein
MSEQIVNVSFTVHGRVQLDLARAEEDPWWDQYSRGLDLTDDEQFKQAVQNYVSAYLRNEQLLSDNAPWTCGPASIYSVQIEVKHGGNTSSDAAAV